MFVLAALAAILSSSLIGAAQRDAAAVAPTVSANNLRTAWDDDEPGLAPQAASAPDFGKLFSTPVDGQVYAQPVLAAGRLIAATENNKVYGLDPVTGALRWTRSIGAPWPAATVGCGDLAPNVGITSTPVYDPTTNSVFVLGKVNDGFDVHHPHWYMHAMDPITGAERSGFPRNIAGAPTNDSAHPFNPETAMQRPGLLLLDGVVYAGFASHCDYGPYVGYVVGVSASSGQQTTMWSTEAGSSFAEAGIWQSGGGLVSDGPGRIIVATGNGVSPAPRAGDSPPSTLAESIVRLQVNSNGSLSAKSFFSPADNAGLDTLDQDLGSGGPMALPPGFGTSAHPRLVVQVGKDGRIFLLDADHLGGSAQGPGGGDAVVSQAGPFKGVWGGPAFFGGGGGFVYTVENSGNLRALRYTVDANGRPTLALAGTSAGTFGYTSGSPTVTSTGTSTGSALVWVIYSTGPTGAGGELRAYDAVPSSGLLRLRYAAPIGTAAKFARVATENGRAYVGTRDGHVLGFGRPTTASMTGSPLTDFGSAALGTPVSRTVTVTAARPLTITGVTADSPFTAAVPALPRTLTTGQQISVPVTYVPDAPGVQSGNLTFNTSAGVANFDLEGRGTRPGLGADPGALNFGTVATGATRTLTVAVTNTGSTPVTITGYTAPHGAYSTEVPPAVGSVLDPASTTSVSIRYTPTVAGPDNQSLTVASSQGSVQIPLLAQAVTGVAHLSVSPNPLNVGAVPVGATGAGTFDVANTGNLGLTITKAAPPTGVFGAPDPLPEGQFISTEDVLHQTITFTPTALGTFTAQYLITSDDGRGPQNVTLTGTGVDDPILAKFLQVSNTPNRPGDPLGPETAIPGGQMQRFSRGTIYWSPATGAHVVLGAILDVYNRFGGPAGQFGFPVTDELTTPDTVGRYTHFANGASVYWTPATSAHEVHGAIRAEWAATGWERGPVGYPTTDETRTPDGIGRYNHFSKNGSIYWTPATNAHEVHGAIRAEWAATGWERGPVGYPTTDETRTPDGIGRYNHFSKNGSVYWTPTLGAHEVHGAIRSAWAALGWERSVVGYPTSDEKVTPKGDGRYNTFSKPGSIYWSPTSGAHEVHGLIRSRWLSLGAERSTYGYPISNEYAIPGGRRSDFQHGRLTYLNGVVR